LYAIFDFVSIFPSPSCGSCLHEYPIGDYYVFDNGQNDLCDGNGAKLNKKKKTRPPLKYNKGYRTRNAQFSISMASLDQWESYVNQYDGFMLNRERASKVVSLAFSKLYYACVVDDNGDRRGDRIFVLERNRNTLKTLFIISQH